VRVAVRDLAAFAGRRGDLAGGHFSLLRGSDGQRAHRRIQSGREASARKEVTVQRSWKGPTLALELHGRIDLLLETPGGLIVEEIKTARLPEGEFPPDAPVHRLQALIYAWMLAVPDQTQQVNSPAARVRYVPPDSGEGWVWPLEITPDQLDTEITAALGAYAIWLTQLLHWREERDQSLRNLSFPFSDLRRGQSELMTAVEQSFHSGLRLHVEAPTGIGKTLAVLVPALRALGTQQVNTLFYATCRNSGKTVVEEALRHLEKQGMRLRALTLVAKDRICNGTGSPCDCATCPLALGFFDRLNPALAELRESPDWSRDRWQDIAARHQLCPFAFLMQAAREADLLIGDINSALDPGARLGFLFEEAPETVGLLIDEAHHLPERARSMNSASLDLNQLSKLLRTLPPTVRGLSTELRRVSRAANALEFGTELAIAASSPGARAAVAATEAPPRELAEACRRAVLAIETSYNLCAAVANDPRPDLLRMLQGFWQSVERHRAAHITYREAQTLHHLCRDPAEFLRDALQALRSSVLFSATLAPMPLFRRLTGSLPEDRELILGSPFEPGSLRMELEKNIPVVFRARGEEMYRKLADRIRQFLEAQPGKNMVFLPSFEVLEEVRRRLPLHDLWFGEVLVQPRGLQEAETVAFLRPLREQSGAITVLAVLGGALNEGIDLPGKQLEGVVVVSIGLPALSPRQELLRAYYQDRGEDGFVLAYTLPGLVRVRQALGRVLRGPGDSGRALLIDPRFEHPFYSSLYPSVQSESEIH